MFVGHYGVSFAAKQVHKPIPLWLLFVAVQWLDVCWSVLVMLGVEKLRVVRGFTEGSNLDLYYMPYTHGLLGAVCLSLLFAGASALFFKERRSRVFWIVAACAFSHWLLDLVVHVPDLPLIGDSVKIGFGLWRNVAISLPLELACLWATMAGDPFVRERVEVIGDEWVEILRPRKPVHSPPGTAPTIRPEEHPTDGWNRQLSVRATEPIPRKSRDLNVRHTALEDPPQCVRRRLCAPVRVCRVVVDQQNFHRVRSGFLAKWACGLPTNAIIGLRRGF